MHVKSLARTLALAVAVIGFIASPAKADNFLFSFTNNAGNTSGTVTGEIFGLVNNSTGPATEVEILTIPPTPSRSTPTRSRPHGTKYWSTVLPRQMASLPWQNLRQSTLQIAF